MRSCVELEDVDFAYGAVPVLEHINLTVEPGDFLGIIGPNGSGKTTLLRIMLGLLAPSRGSVRLFGHPPASFGQWGRLGYVPQKDIVHTQLTVARALYYTALLRLPTDTGPDELLRAFVRAGWVDRCKCHKFRVHDWPHHVDQGVERSKDVKASGFLDCYLDTSSILLDDDYQPAGPAVAVAIAVAGASAEAEAVAPSGGQKPAGSGKPHKSASVG